MRYAALRTNCFITVLAKKGSHVKGWVLAEILKTVVTRELLSRVRIQPWINICTETYNTLVCTPLAIKIAPSQEFLVLS